MIRSQINKHGLIRGLSKPRPLRRVADSGAELCYWHLLLLRAVTRYSYSPSPLLHFSLPSYTPFGPPDCYLYLSCRILPLTVTVTGYECRRRESCGPRVVHLIRPPISPFFDPPNVNPASGSLATGAIQSLEVLSTSPPAPSGKSFHS